MLIDKRRRRGPKNKDCQPCSFRFDDETKRRLTAIGVYSGKKQTVIVEELIDKAYEEIREKDGQELKRAERSIQS